MRLVALHVAAPRCFSPVGLFLCFTPVGLFLFFAFLGGCRSFHSVGKTLRAKAKLVSGYSLLEFFFVRLTVCLSFPIKKFNSNVDSVSVVVKSGITISDITSPNFFSLCDC